MGKRGISVINIPMNVLRVDVRSKYLMYMEMRIFWMKRVVLKPPVDKSVGLEVEKMKRGRARS